MTRRKKHYYWFIYLEPQKLNPTFSLHAGNETCYLDDTISSRISQKMCFLFKYSSPLGLVSNIFKGVAKLCVCVTHSKLSHLVGFYFPGHLICICVIFHVVTEIERNKDK